MNKRYLIKPHINISPLLQSLFLTIKQNRVFKPGTDCQVKAVPVSLERSIVTSGLASPTPSTSAGKTHGKPHLHRHVHQRFPAWAVAAGVVLGPFITQGRTRDEGLVRDVVDLACSHRRGVYLGLDAAASQCSTGSHSRDAHSLLLPHGASFITKQRSTSRSSRCCLRKAVARH